MNKKLLLAYTMICTSVFASTDPAFVAKLVEGRRTATHVAAAAATKIIFRNAPRKHLPQQKYFQDTYPESVALESSSTLERGLNRSVIEPFFMQVLQRVAHLVDTRRTSSSDVYVADFGCGNGLTTLLFCLAGAKAYGVEKYFTTQEQAAFLKYVTLWSTTVATPLGFNLTERFYLGTHQDVMDLHTLPQFPDKFFDVVFSGYFFHMFDPATAKKIVEQQAYRMLKRGGTVYACVDGVNSFPGEKAKEAYRLAKAAGKKFPTILEICRIGFGKAEDGIAGFDPSPPPY